MTVPDRRDCRFGRIGRIRTADLLRKERQVLVILLPDSIQVLLDLVTSFWSLYLRRRAAVVAAENDLGHEDAISAHRWSCLRKEGLI